MIATGLRNLLMTTAEIHDRVRRRIYPVRPPQNVSLPYVTYRQSSLQLGDGLGTTGGEEESVGPDTARFEVRCYALEYDQAVELADAVLTLLRSHTGLMGDNSTQRCKYARVEDVRDEEVEQQEGQDVTEFLTVVDCKIVYDPTEV